MKTYTDLELEYAATACCKCGAGLAHPLDIEASMKLCAWVCSYALKHADAKPADHEAFPYAFYKVREEGSINNRGGHTTRPTGTVLRTIGMATCGACGHQWESEPYCACGLSHHWYPGACPKCGNDCNAHGSGSSADTRPPIDVRFRDVVLSQPAKGGSA